MSGFRSFDPDAFIGRAGAAEPTPQRDGLPDAWRTGLQLLRERAAPPGAHPQRWQQLVADCHTFALRLGHEAISLGWTIGNVFGFELEQPDNLVGAALDIRGGHVVAITDEWMAVRGVKGGTAYLRREMPDDATPIWTFRGRISR